MQVQWLCLVTQITQILNQLLFVNLLRVKVNANIGTSPLTHCLDLENNKIKACKEAGADTIMDLSISGDLDTIRKSMIAQWQKPIGTVPMYAVGQQILDADKPISSMDPELLLKKLKNKQNKVLII